MWYREGRVVDSLLEVVCGELTSSPKGKNCGSVCGGEASMKN